MSSPLSWLASLVFTDCKCFLGAIFVKCVLIEFLPYTNSLSSLFCVFFLHHFFSIVAVILQGGVLPPNADGSTRYSSFSGFAHLSAGLCCGLSGLAAGMCIGIAGDAGVRAVGQNDKLFVGMLLILIFSEAIGLFGLITALILSQQSYACSSA